MYFMGRLCSYMIILQQPAIPPLAVACRSRQLRSGISDSWAAHTAVQNYREAFAKLVARG